MPRSGAEECYYTGGTRTCSPPRPSARAPNYTNLAYAFTLDDEALKAKF